MTRVVHCKKEPFDIYVGRPSLLGNPFRIGPDGTRAEVIAKYRVYAIKRMKTDEKFAAEIRKCKGKTISCWCVPEWCHGHVIAELAEAE